MEIQVKSQKMGVHAARDLTNRLLGYRRKNGITQLLKKGCTDTGNTIYSWSDMSELGLGQRTCKNKASCYSPRSPTDGHEINIHVVDDGFEVEWNLDIEKL